jgi:TetR/AcrR family transcriptional regulator, transcriptional repressor for nem operon
MRKGEQTRQRILEQAADLFNVQGYSGASINDLVRATGLEKGGIYNHFGSKEQLALEAFDYNMSRVRDRFAAALEGRRLALDRLTAIMVLFEEMATDPYIAGGCPIVNTAVEADDMYPELKVRAQSAMDELLQLVIRVVNKGIERDELSPDLDTSTFANFFIAALEGGLILSRLNDDPGHIQGVIQHIQGYLVSLQKEPSNG